MNLPGRLRATTLGDLLGKLHRAHADGILELVEVEGVSAGRAHRVYLERGLIDAVDTALPTPRLGELLRGSGELAEEALPRVASRSLAEPGRRFGELLLEERLVTREALRSGLQRQLWLKLDALFRLPEALIRFHVRRPRRASEVGPLLGPREFLHNRPRARGRAGAPPLAAAHAEAYRCLGLAPGADSAAVQRAFRRLAKVAHPDRHPNADARERARLLSDFANLSAAYHTLVR